MLLLPALIRSGMRAPKGRAAWEAYWNGVRRTGSSGDVLWDSANDDELAFCARAAREHMDPSLPLLDIGCGNGRYSRAFARIFPRVLGVDLAHAAIGHAERESRVSSRVEFVVADATATDFAGTVEARIAPSHVFVRGLLHVLGLRERRALLANVEAVLDGRGCLFLFETAFGGGPLEYIEFLGGDHRAIPRQLWHCIASGIPKPRRFGRAEFERHFPSAEWQTLAAGPADVYAVGMHAQREFERIPGFYAIVKPSVRRRTTLR